MADGPRVARDRAARTLALASAWASLILIPFTGLVRLHSDSLALRAAPFTFLVVDVPFKFFHGDFAALAGHNVPLVRRSHCLIWMGTNYLNLRRSATKPPKVHSSPAPPRVAGSKRCRCFIGTESSSNVSLNDQVPSSRSVYSTSAVTVPLVMFMPSMVSTSCCNVRSQKE